MTELATARRLILERLRPLDPEQVDLASADGRLLAEDVLAPFDLPRWDNSAMDGYAVRHADCGPGVTLTVIGKVAAGDAGEAEVAQGSAMQILTGAPMPPGTDTVIPFEEVELLAGAIRVARQPVLGDHVRRRGGDLHSGDRCLAAGWVIGPPEAAVLAAIGRTEVSVRRSPTVAILSTGNELVEAGGALRPGAIYDSNGPMLAAAVRRAGGAPRRLATARDDGADLRLRLREGLEADVLITSAGVSTGERDLVRETLAELGAEEVFYKVDIQPGRPFAFAVAGSTVIFSLPGNPVAALLTFEVFVRPALRRLQGAHDAVGPMMRARLEVEATPRPDRTTLQRVIVERHQDGLVVKSAGGQATGLVLTLAKADAIAFIPPGTRPLPAGTLVDIQFLRSEGAMAQER